MSIQQQRGEEQQQPYAWRFISCASLHTLAAADRWYDAWMPAVLPAAAAAAAALESLQLHSPLLHPVLLEEAPPSTQ